MWVGGGSADPVVPGIFYLKYKIWRLFLKGSCSSGTIAHLSSEPQMIYTELSLLEKTSVLLLADKMLHIDAKSRIFC